MKPKSIRSFFVIQSAPSLALVAAITAFATGLSSATTWVWDGGASTGDWKTGANWSPDIATTFPTGFPEVGGTFSNRLTVNGSTALVYDGSLGTTVYGATSVRGLVVGSGSNGSMTITGGTFSSAGSDILDAIGNGGGTGILTIAGGNYISPSLGASPNKGTSLGLGGTGGSTLTISSGSATFSTLTLNGSSATINLNGGVLAMNDIVRLGGTNTINFNGGTLKPLSSAPAFFPNLSNTSAFVKSGGAIVDTDGSDITISEPLLEDSGSTGGGITKNGFGVLTLGAVSTTTGSATVNAGGLGVAAGAASWAPSSVTHSGDQLDFNFGTYSGANPVPVDTGAVTIDSTVIVNITGSGFPTSGEVKLLEYTSRSGAGFLEAGSMPAGLEAATIEENTVDGYFYLNIPLPSGNNLVWSVGTGDWDDSSLNWNGNTEAYAEPALVTFPDLTGGGAVTLIGGRAPLAVTINNEAGNDYIFAGSELSGAGTLTKEGTGSATFSNDVALTGAFAINGGKLTLSSMPASPSFTIGTGATLEINRASDQGRNIKDLAISGGGTFIKSGAGELVLVRPEGDASPYVWSLGTGSQIRVEGGRLKVSDYNTLSDFSNNHASLHIGSGATFEALQSNVTIDALTGEGIYQAGWFGPRKLTIGVDGGSGTFSGTIQGNGVGGAVASVPLLKRGNGEQILDGTLNFRGAYGNPSIEVVDGTLASPSRLTISPVGASVIGADSESIYTSTGINDVTELTQTSGTLVASSFGIAEKSQGTYNFSGGLVNTLFLSFAYTGDGSGNNGPAVMNISDSAQLNVLYDGDIRMGVYWGRNITINQSGGEVVQFSDAGSTRGGTGRLNFSGGNQNMTWNLSGGTLSIAGMAWQPAGGGAGGGNGVLNLNGGVLQITNAAFAAPTGDANGKPKVAAFALGDGGTPDSGAIIDNYGLDVTFAAPILHGGSSVFDGGLKVETSVLGGSLTLSGLNTYTGNTTVQPGNTLVLADDAGLTFVLDGTESNKITGMGTVTINGDFTIDTAFADLTNGNTWTLVDVTTLAENFSSSFTLAGFTEAGTSGVHTMTVGSSNLWTFTESTGVLSVSVPSAGGYSSWIGGFTVSDPAEGADPDYDGMENLLEFVLNGNPSISDPAILPDLVVTDTHYQFTFTRRDDSLAPETTQIFQYGTDLTGWTDVVVPAASGTVGAATFAVTDSTPADTVTVSILKALAPGGKLFGRLKVTKP